MHLSPEIIASIKSVAASSNVDAALLCSVVEIEGGSVDALLFERHEFTTNLRTLDPSQIALAKVQGLAVEKWLGSKEYKDEKTHDQRVSMLNKACAINEEAACRSASFGLFQILGSNFRLAGYANAVELREKFAAGGAQEQLSAFIRMSGKNGALVALKSKDWSKFALIWNGKGFKKNSYDSRLASAYAQWSSHARSNRGDVTPVQRDPNDQALRLGDHGTRVSALQTALRDKGYQLLSDGQFGPATKRAVAASQVDLGLPGSGIADPAFVSRVEASDPISKGSREVATVSDLRARGSRTVKSADTLRKTGHGLGAIGATFGALDALGSLNGATDAISSAGDTLDKVTSAQSTLQHVFETLTGHPGLLIAAAALVVAAVIWSKASAIISARLEDHSEGKTV